MDNAKDYIFVNNWYCPACSGKASLLVNNSTWYYQCENCHFRGPDMPTPQDAQRAWQAVIQTLELVPALVARMDEFAQMKYLPQLLCAIENAAGNYAFGAMLNAVRIRQDDGCWMVQSEFSRQERSKPC